MKNLKFILLPLLFSIVLNAYSQEGWFLQKTNGVTWEIQSISFIDKNNGWAVSQNGDIEYTSDGGSNWAILSKDDNQNLVLDISFIDLLHGWACDYNGDVKITSDGGLNWKKKQVGAGDLVKIMFIDSLTGWSVSYYGTIFKTIDGGENWKKKYSDKNARLCKLFTTDSLNCWVVGVHGMILHTNDGGINWNTQNSELSIDTLESVFFLDTLNGWAAGSNGIIIHTIDGGNKWKKQNSNINKHLWDLYFFNINRGWAVGDEGIILFTTDGGNKWVQHISGVNKKILKLSFVDSTNGWACGWFSPPLLRTTTGGITFVENDSMPNNYMFCNPNPFSDNISIKYHIENPSIVRLSLIDIFGREIAHLVDNYQETGIYSQIFNGKDLEPGFYFVRLNIQNKIINNKILLIK